MSNYFLKAELKFIFLLKPKLLLAEIAQLKAKTEKLEKRPIEYEREQRKQREFDAQVKKNTETPARS
jgi:hypothetical protein